VRAACDRFAGVFEATEGQDGYVSIEVSPSQAFDADATVLEARRLWSTVDRPNAMVKVPGTIEGARAIRRLISEGINVNVTLLFAIEAHDHVIEAYSAGLEDRLAAGQPIDRLASVASFFVSRVDTEIDKRLNAMAADDPRRTREHLLSLRGRAAIANARLAYRLFTQRFSGIAGSDWRPKARWSNARSGRARRRRIRVRDVVYVEQLIGTPHREHAAAGDHGRIPRSRSGRPDRGHERRRRGGGPGGAGGSRHSNQPGDRAAPGRRRNVVPALIRLTPRGPQPEDCVARRQLRMTTPVSATPSASQSVDRTKIVCTLGPSSASPEVIGALLDAGLSVARINFARHARHPRARHFTRQTVGRRAWPTGGDPGRPAGAAHPRRRSRAPVMVAPGDEVVLCDEGGAAGATCRSRTLTWRGT
jgi:hypothetical protein